MESMTINTQIEAVTGILDNCFMFFSFLRMVTAIMSYIPSFYPYLRFFGLFKNV